MNRRGLLQAGIAAVLGRIVPIAAPELVILGEPYTWGSIELKLDPNTVYFLPEYATIQIDSPGGLVESEDDLFRGIIPE